MNSIKLSELISQVEDAITQRFEGEIFWITAEITDVKRYYEKKWCFLKFIEKDGNQISTEIKGVFWGTTYPSILKFEKFTGQVFGNGLEINCAVRVRFHKRFGLDLEVLDIDAAYSLGKLEVERQETLARLLKENPKSIFTEDGRYFTANNRMELPRVFKRIALITAPGSDGQRDFVQELKNNPYGYAYKLDEYLTQIQGDQAAAMIFGQMEKVRKSGVQYDAVAIVRGGGSQTDFKPFDDFELANCVANFPVPVITGIGHDRNTSIVDMMARQHKTPTKVAGFFIEWNFNFEAEIMMMKERFFQAVQSKLEECKRNIADIKETLEDSLESFLSDKNTQLLHLKRVIKSLSPETIMGKGFAVLMKDSKIITNPALIDSSDKIEAVLKNKIIYTTVTDKKDAETNDL